MPTSAWRRTAGLMPLAAIPSLGADYPRPNDPLIATWSWCCVGQLFHSTAASNTTSITYPGASRALAVPFEIAYPFLVRKVFWLNGTTASTDSADVGVYTEAGARLVSGGGTAISGTNSMQEVDVTDTLLRPGRYWLAYAQNGVTATPYGFSTTAAVWRACGAAQMASAYVLPSTFTPAAVAGTTIPLFGIAARTLAA